MMENCNFHRENVLPSLFHAIFITKYRINYSKQEIKYSNELFSWKERQGAPLSWRN